MGLNEATAICEEFFDKWVAEDGLARLDPGDAHAPFPGAKLATVNNDNGILFLVYFLLLARQKGALAFEDRAIFQGAVERLQVVFRDRSCPGYYNRKQGLTYVKEAHDNYAAIASGSVLFGLPFATDICEAGERNGWCFDNTFPGNFSSDCVRQGGEVAFYKACALRTPAIWEWLWLCVGLVTGGLFGNPSTMQLCWMRVEALDLALSKTAFDCPEPFRLTYLCASLFWRACVRLRFKNPLGFFSQYFREDHPIIKLWKLEG